MTEQPKRFPGHPSPGHALTEPALAPAEALPGHATPHGRVLGNGRYRALISDAGSGGAWLGDQALTGWRGDRVEDDDGWFLYLRDLDDGSFWSLGRRPVPSTPDRYAVEDEPGSFAIVRLERGIEARMDAWVDADHDAECRRVTLRNLTAAARRIELTSYLEVVLHDPRRHAGHPAFSRLFVQTEIVRRSDLLLARRRPRSADESHPWLAHALRGGTTPSCETDRARFLGRGRGPDRPLALALPGPLSDYAGDVLDPVLAQRRVVEIPAGGAVALDLLLAAAPDRAQALTLAARFVRAEDFAASRSRAQAAARARHTRHGLDSIEGGRLDVLAAALLCRAPGLRAAAAVPGARAGDPEPDATPAGETLAAVSAMIAAGRPIVLIAPDAPASVRSQALAAQAYWRDLGLATGLVIVTEGAAAAPDGDAGVVSVAARDLAPGEYAALEPMADLVAHDRLAPPAAPPAQAADGTAAAARAAPAPLEAGATDGRAEPWPFADEPLRFDNGFGGFTAQGDEYVIRLPSELGVPRLTPRPWINVLANPGFGAIVSETGAGCTWSRNSREFRLTPWRNDPVRDPHDEALYVRDDESGRSWSPFPGPIAGEGPYEMRHGFGYSRCRHAGAGLELDTVVFVHATEPVKIVEISVTNPGPRRRTLSLVAYQRLVLGELPDRATGSVTLWKNAAGDILMARRAGGGPFAGAVAFAAPVSGDGSRVRLGGDREAFLGAGGSPTRPAVLRGGGAIDERVGAGLDPCFCTQVGLEIGPGETRSCAFLLGEARGAGAVETLVGALRGPGALDEALEQVRSHWRDLTGRMRVETPVPALDLMLNGWSAYQTLACRLWGRSALYQSGGAYGFRDQLQDAASFLAVAPNITREQILLHARHQFVEGDVLHWWHPPEGRGIRTRFADDLLWLPLVTAAYVRSTGDAPVLEERVPFLAAPPLAADEDEVFLLPHDSGESADLYEHCCRAIDRSLVTGPHGLPLFGSGDWNDGMNRVGRGGRGESVWMACFLIAVIDAFTPLCDARDDGVRAGRYRRAAGRLGAALETAGWDGDWYRRGYFDDGTPLGSGDDEECRIDALVQAWAVLSGAAPSERAEQAMDAVERHLVSWEDGLVRLLAPPFDRMAHDPGYIKGYLPGVRENGGQYTHAALWVVEAMARLGRRAVAARLLEWISPVTRSATAAAVRLYGAEPYAVAADVSTNAAHRGEAGWTWYTGSSGWMTRVTLEALLGVTLEHGTHLVVRATIPPDWPGYRLALRPWGGAGTWEIVVRNESVAAAEVVRVVLDRVALDPVDGSARIPILADGRDHRVEIELR